MAKKNIKHNTVAKLTDSGVTIKNPAEIAPKKIKKLNAMQKRFLTYYLFDPETRGNGKGSWSLACEGRQSSATCVTRAVETLKNPLSKMYMQDLLLENGFNEEFVDGELIKVVKQDERLGDKVSAIKEFNNLMGRTKEHTQAQGISITINGKSHDESIIDSAEIAELI